MYKYKNIITIILIIILLGISTLVIAETNYTDSNQYNISLNEENNAIKIDDIIIKYNDFLYKVFCSDLTNDGIDEVIIATKHEGTASSLSYKVYKINNNKAEIIFERQDIYKGKLNVINNKIIEEIPNYNEDDSNGNPSSYIKNEFIYENDKFKLIDSKNISLNNEKKFRAQDIYYENPSWVEIEKIMDEVALEKCIPPAILKAMAYTESGFKQFKDGQPLLSFDGLSWGIMQVTPRASHDLERLKYDIKYNIREGANILLEKWGTALSSNSSIPNIGNLDPRVLENWYFIIWAYNGWHESNNPNMIPYEFKTWTKTYAYQEKVLDIAKSKFNQDISRINTEDLPLEGKPSKTENGIYTTPEPIHTISFKGYEVGDILIDTTTNGITLRDKDNGWKSIGRNSSKKAFKVLNKSPILHNGYLRLKIETIEEDDSEGITAWVAMNWNRQLKYADFNNNSKIDRDDLNKIIEKDGTNILINDPNEKYDINYDLKIDLNDLNLSLLKFNEYNLNDILINVSDIGLVLRDKNNNWEKVTSIAPYKPLVVLNKKPIYHDGYFRLNVKTLEPDEKAGWVAMDWINEPRSYDVNKDNVINIYDLIEISKYINQNLQPEDLNNKYDINYDKKIDSEDLNLVLLKAKENIDTTGSLNSDLNPSSSVPDIIIKADKNSILKDDTFTISIKGRNIKDLYTAVIQLKFDTNILKVVGNKPVNNEGSILNSTNSISEFINRIDPNDSSIIQNVISLKENNSGINIDNEYENISSITFKAKEDINVPLESLFSINNTSDKSGDVSIKLINSNLETLEYTSDKIEYKYDGNGNLKEKYIYKNVNGEYKIRYKYYYGENECLKTKIEYDKYENKIAKYTYIINNNNSQLQYKYVYDTDGTLKYKKEYKDGKYIGKYTYYKDSEGNYRYKFKYVYDVNGNLIYKNEYKDGKKIAKYTYYVDSKGDYRYKFKYIYDNGTLKYKEEYRDGKKIAKYTYYVDSKGNYRYKFKYVYDNGTLKYKEEYKNGKIVAKYTYYVDSEGDYRYKFKYVYDINENITYKYEYNNGNKIAKYTYYKDEEGKYRYKFKYVYGDNESLKYKYEYYNGKKKAKYTYYIDSKGNYRYKYKYIYNLSGTKYIKRYTYQDGKIISVKTY